MLPKVKAPLLLALAFIAFVSLSLIFRGGDHHYESGVYTAYAESILKDGDFNIINQMHFGNSWIVTPSYHHPDGHPITQTPFIFLFHLFELASATLTGIDVTAEFQYFLSSLTINFALFFLIFYFLNSLNQHFFNKSTKAVLFFFLFGSTFFYFNFFATNVTDIFSIPLLCYCILRHHQFKSSSQNFQELFYYGLSLGILCSLKLLYIPLSLYWLGSFLFHQKKALDFKHLLAMFFSFLSAPLVLSINTYLKFGSFYLESSYVARILFDYSLSHLLQKFFMGYFGINGFFFFNPALLIGLIAFVMLGWLIFKKNMTLPSFNKADYLAYLIFLGIIFFHPIFVMGTLVEDLLPGRATLITLPFLVISLIYVIDYFKVKKNLIMMGFSAVIIWNAFITLNFVIIDAKDALLFYKNKFVFQFPDNHLYLHYLDKIEVSFNSLTNLFPSLILYSLILSALYFLAQKSKKIFRFQTLLLFWLICFSCFTLINSYNTNSNVKALKSKGFFNNKVVGNGLEIYMYDYILDRFNSVNINSDFQLEEKLNKRAEIYYSVIEKQIIKSTPEFREKQRTKAWKDLTMH